MNFLVGSLLLLSSSFVVCAQKIDFVGTIYDPGGAVVVGASVAAKDEKGSSFVSKSDNDGRFSVALEPGLYELEISSPGFLAIKYREYLIVNSTNGKMMMDFVMFGGKYHEPCGVSGGDCLPPNLLIKSYTVEQNPKLRRIRDDFAPETKRKRQ